MNEKRKWITAWRLRRGVVVLAAAGLTAGAALATAGSAVAAGTEANSLSILSGVGGSVITTGSLTGTYAWKTTDACPTNFTGSAVLHMFVGTTDDGIVSNTLSSAATPLAGTFLDTIGNLLSGNGITPTTPGTAQLVVDCYPTTGLQGTPEFVQYLYLSVASGATSWTSSYTGPVQTATTTNLVASPNPAGNSASVTLTATESPATAGSVTFMNGATVIASSVAVNASGVATTTFTTPAAFTSALSLSATFSPTSTSFSGSTGTTTLNSNAVQTAINSPVAVSFTISASGSLTVTVATPATAALSGTFPTFTGTLPNVTVTDTYNNYPGWSVMGQESAFTSSALPSTPISGNQLGWIPAAGTGSNTFDGLYVQLGGAVAPGSPGLGTTAAVLAVADAGHGSDPTGATSWVATAALTLDIPASTTAGAYSGTLAITYLTAGPQVGGTVGTGGTF